MGWITLAQARTGANTTASSNAAAKLIAAWLDGIKASIDVSRDHPTDTVYSRDGIAFRQEKDVSAREYRGLAQDLAEFLARYLDEDTTRQWMMYGVDARGELHEVEATYGPPSAQALNTLYYQPGEAGSWKSVTQVSTKLGYSFYPPTAGIRVEAAAQKVNAADGWMVRVSETTFAVPAYGYGSNARTANKAFLPIPPNEAWDGVVVSRSKSKVFVAKDGNTSVYQNTTTVVREYRYLSQSQADAKVASEAVQASRTLDVRVTVSWSSSGEQVYKNVQVRGGGANGTTAATDKVPTSRPQGHGLYTVSVNETTYQVTNS